MFCTYTLTGPRFILIFSPEMLKLGNTLLAIGVISVQQLYVAQIVGVQVAQESQYLKK
jgi:hypothetical protein